MVAAALHPCLSFRDPDRTRDWLIRAFAFEQGAEYRDDNGVLQHAELWCGDVCIMFGSPENGSPELAMDPGTGAVYVIVDDADTHHARAVAAGAEVIRELSDQSYGSRDYSVRDPEGNVWNFGTYRPSKADR